MVRLARLNALRGRREKALDYLCRAVAAGVPSDRGYLLREPDFEALRDDPEFEAIVAGVGDGG